MTRQERGHAGEVLAADYLSVRGYQLVEKNFRTPRGEVDIVAVYAETLVFVEVKSWRTVGMTELGYAIDKSKQLRIRSVASTFLRRNPQLAGYRVRFDVIFVPADNSEIVHLADAF